MFPRDTLCRCRLHNFHTLLPNGFTIKFPDAFVWLAKELIALWCQILSVIILWKVTKRLAWDYMISVPHCKAPVPTFTINRLHCFLLCQHYRGKQYYGYRKFQNISDEDMYEYEDFHDKIDPWDNNGLDTYPSPSATKISMGMVVVYIGLVSCLMRKRR